jgi:flagellar basal body-associated protein FliL
VIRTLLVGFWVCAIALGATYLATQLSASDVGQAESAIPENVAVEYIKTDALSVPVIRDGKVQGYVVAQVSFAVGSDKSKSETVDPAPYLVDAAFRAFYEAAPLDFMRLKPQDIPAIAEKTKTYANERLGGGTVKDVLISGLNYVARGEVRTNWVKKAP